MSKDKLLEDVSREIDKEFKYDVMDVTEQFKEDMEELLTRIASFWESVDEDFDISNLKVYLENRILAFFGLGPLGKNMAANVDNKIILSRRLVKKSFKIRIFVITHELVHFLAQGKYVKVGSNIHNRTGYGLRHFGYDDNKDNIIMKKYFFEYFNEGMDDWATILILGKDYKEFFKKNKMDGKIYELIKFLVNSVGDSLTQKDVIKDYINRGAKFMQAIHKKYGKHSIAILNQMNKTNLDDTLEFFMTDDENRREELRYQLAQDKK